MSSRIDAAPRSTVARDDLGLSTPYIAPKTPAEEKLEEIWRAVLMMDRVGVADRYLDLGGDSFSATVIFAMIDETLGVSLPMASLGAAPTIAALAQRIDLAKKDKEPESA
jgi:acyl carrier protein